MLKNTDLVQFCLDFIGHPYWYGTCVYKATNSLLTSKSERYASHYTSSRTSRYKQDIKDKRVVADCVGMIKGFAWTNGGIGVKEADGTDNKITNKYKSNDCPDTSANGMLSYCKKQGCAWGNISTIPEVPGLAVHSNGHIGVYVGDGWVVEERGFKYGCVKTKLKERPWTSWCQLPFISYEGTILEDKSEVTTEPEVELHLGDRTLKNGLEGNDVKELQTILNELNYDLGSYGIDGDFGSATEKALIKFQQDYNLPVTRIVDTETLNMLKNPTKPDKTEEETPQKQIGIAFAMTSMKLREAPNTKAKQLGIIRPNTLVEVYEINEDGWLKINTLKGMGWSSNTTGTYYNVIPLIPDVMIGATPQDFNKEYDNTFKTTGRLNVRENAGIENKSMLVLPEGAKVDGTGWYTKIEDRDWLYINFIHNNKKYVGFASSKYLRKV